MSKSERLEETRSALARVQEVDTASLGRRDDLGQALNFEEIIPDVQKLIGLFKRIPKEVLAELPDQQLQQILGAANSTRKLFDDVMQFDPKQANPSDARTNLINQISGHYNSIFGNVYPWISYGVARTVDFNGLDTEARAVVKGLEDRAAAMEQVFEDREKKIDDLEQQLRSTLAEQGVSQQAKYFGDEADKHVTLANKWGQSTGRWAAAVAIAALASFFTHRIPWIAPTNVAEAIQFIASKVLLIGALTFMLIRSARNYRAHKHNEVINRHKQNALLTFNALVEAGATPETRNTVLNHAAASIYAQPDSGYVNSSSDRGTSNTTLVEMLPRASAQLTDGG